MLLIYNDEQSASGMSPEDRERVMQDYFAYTQSIQQEGIMRAGDALQPTSTATTVRVRDGETLISDGPFAETKEALGGYYLVEADDLDTAIAAAKRIPGAKTGTIEVRPVVVFE
jgi:hypothetical protein